MSNDKNAKSLLLISLSDEDIVKRLILSRVYIYSENTLNHINYNAEFGSMNEDLIALYISLDDLINRCNFNDRQLRLLELLFDGYSIYDIHNMDIGFGRSATYDLFNRIVKRITDKNKEMELPRK